MKKLLAAALIVGAASPLVWADDSTGLYVGARLGYNSPSMTTEDTDCYNECSAYTLRPTGAGLGIQVGQNFSSGSLLLGWSLNDDMASQKQSITYGSLDYNGGSSTSSRATIDSKLKSMMSLRFKAGLQINDTALVASFGPARGEFDESFQYMNNGTSAPSAYDSESETLTGTVTGLSLEHNFSRQLMGSLDFSSYNFKNKFTTITQTGSPNSHAQLNFVSNVSQIAVTANYRF